MNIFSVRDRFYAKVNGRFSLRTLETALDAKLHMRSGSFAEQYCKGIFLAIFQDAVDLRQVPEHRGCGLAAQLLGEAICPLRAGGAKHLRLLRPVTDKGTKRLLATYGITDGCSIVPTEE